MLEMLDLCWFYDATTLVIAGLCWKCWFWGPRV